MSKLPIMLGQVGYQRTADLAGLATAALKIENCAKGRPYIAGSTSCPHCGNILPNTDCKGVKDNPPLESGNSMPEPGKPPEELKGD